MRDKVLGTLLVGFVIGIFIRSFIIVPQIFLYISFGLGFIFFIGSSFTKKQFLFPLLTGFFFVAIAFGIFRFDLGDHNHGDPMFVEMTGQKVTIAGMIDDEPDVRELNTKLTVKVEKFNDKTITVPTTLLVTTNDKTEFAYGENIIAKGSIALPANFLTNTGKEFDYVSYLGKDNIYFLLNNTEVTVESRDNGSLVISKLFSVKESFLKKIESVLPRPESSLLGGLLLGTKQALGQELRQDFVTTGTIHIVALSGYNVTIVAEAMMRFFRLFLSQIVSIWFGVFSIILFCILSGGSSTAVRASIMAILALIARATGRTSDIARALFLTLFFMLLFNPKLLVFDISFQLSFLATLGLIYIAPILEQKFQWIKWNNFRSIAAATIAAQIAVLPFILYTMGTLSLIALPINLIILPFVPLTMLVGFVGGALAYISHLFALPVAYFAYGLLHGTLYLITQSANVPYASISITHMPMIVVIGLYMVIVWWIYKSQKTADVTNSSTVRPNI